jgi:hypothetical protein
MNDDKIYVDFTISSNDKTTNVAFHVDDDAVWQEALDPIIQTFEGHWGYTINLQTPSNFSGDTVGIYYPGKYDDE